MGRRIDESIFGCEERSVDTTESILGFVNQVDPLPLLLEVADSPFSTSMALPCAAAKLDYISASIESAKTVLQFWLQLSYTADRNGIPRFRRKVDVVLDKSGFAPGNIREEVDAHIVEQAICS